MRLKTSPAFFILMVVLFSFGFQCGKDSFTAIPKNQFIEKVALFPNKKSYQIGDTIWVQFQTTSKSLYESVTSQVIPTDTTFLALNFQYEKRYPIDFVPTDTFSRAVTPSGLIQGAKVHSGGRVYNYIYTTDCNEKFYDVKIGFVPRTNGIYSINGPAGELFDCPNKVTRSPYSVISFRFDLTDCNKDVFLSIPPASRGESVKGYTEREIDNKKIFFFKVE